VTAQLLVWLHSGWIMIRQNGVFLGVGYDYGLYYAQTMALSAGQAADMYRLDVIDRFHQILAAYTSYPEMHLPYGPVPYPPLFAWLFTPFTGPTAQVGFALWTALNLVALGHLAWRAARQFPDHRRLVAAGLVLVSPGVQQSLYLGQPMILLGCAMGACYLALRAGQDFRAGLWLACLLLKPHYGLLMVRCCSGSGGGAPLPAWSWVPVWWPSARWSRSDCLRSSPMRRL
jgi:hypothetical protein